MMLATYKCGCPPAEKDPCSPSHEPTSCGKRVTIKSPCPHDCCEISYCCTPCEEVKRITTKPPSPQDCYESPCCCNKPSPDARRVATKPPSLQNCCESPCCCKPSPEPVCCKPEVETPSTCCPVMPSGDSKEFARPRELRSEIAEKGLPYKELEVSFNNNKLVIRTQKEPVKPEYDPPCDCIEDSQPKQEESPEIGQEPAPGSRTVTLYPRAKQSSPELSAEDISSQDEVDEVKRIEKDENPNIFLFRVKKKSNHFDKKFSIDLEYKVPQPWSMKKRMEYMEKIQLIAPEKAPTVCSTASMTKKTKKAHKKGKKKKKLAFPATQKQQPIPKTVTICHQ